MNLWRMLSAVALVALMSMPAIAEQTSPYQLALNGSITNRYLGDLKLGSINNGGLQYYVDNATGGRVLAVEYYSNDNQVDQTRGVELGKESFGFGINSRLAPFKVTLAGSIDRYMLGDDYWALGIYPELPFSNGAASFAIERDADANVMTSARATRNGSAWSGSIGLSREQNRDDDAEQRVGLMIARNMMPAGLTTLTAATVNTTDGPTWVAGVAHPARIERDGANPAIMGFVRVKPEAVDVSGLASLWGQTLSAGTFRGIGESMFNGSLSRTRVVRNRDFATVGVGGGYDQLDFGRVVSNFSYTDVDAGNGLHLKFSNIGVFGTLPGRFTVVGMHLDDPFIGVDRQVITDLAPDPQSGVTRAWEQNWTTLTFGCKIRLSTKAPSPVKQSGYIRLKSYLRFGNGFDGAYLGATLWS